jgi:DtxR family Mn-dependent transcriptional regulator
MAHGAPNQADDYLSAIWLLTAPIGEPTHGRRSPTAPANIARMRGVSRPTVAEMLTKLEARGLVERGARKEALLTELGRVDAMRTVRKHRLLATFLVEQLGYEPWEAVGHVRQLADGFGDGPIERLYEMLGRPERSPHGFPIDPDHELRENPTLTLATRAEPGGRAIVVRVSERDLEVQQQLLGVGLAPGSEVEVAEGTRGGVSLAGDGGATVELDATAADAVYLRASGVPEVPATATCWADILLRERALARE